MNPTEVGCWAVVSYSACMFLGAWLQKHFSILGPYRKSKNHDGDS